jgi:hypothetical protein
MERLTLFEGVKASPPILVVEVIAAKEVAVLAASIMRATASIMRFRFIV